MKIDNNRLRYRPDIQGLRAVAVLLIIFCHAKLPGFRGGFIGVDVFFVLSGYLISGLLITEFSRKGTINFSGFYLRRLQRLAPAMLTMLLLSSALVYLLISPKAQAPQFLAAATAAMWMSNIHFALGQVGYFAAAATENAFLHTWSLSVEEQFYLIWPALIFLTLRTKRPCSTASPLKRLVLAFLLVAVISFLACLYLSYNNAIAAYYLTTSRAWQFAIGALAFLFIIRAKKSVAATPPLTQSGLSIAFFACGWMGFGLVAASAVNLTETSNYPGIWALSPSFGTAMILIAGTNSVRFGFTKLLSTKPLILLGNLSYSWYLWHWPVLVFARILQPEMSFKVRAASIAISLILAVLSYRLVESPTRQSTFLRSRPRFFGITACLTMFLIASSQLWMIKNRQLDIFDPQLDRYYAAKNDLPLIYEMECDDWTESAEIKRCEFGAKTPKYEAILIGDSIAGQWFSAFSEIAEWPHWRFTVITKSSCPMVDKAFFYPALGRRFEECETWRDNIIVEISKTRPDLVILSSVHNYPFTPGEWEAGTVKILQHISSNVEEVILLRSTPLLNFDMLDCLQNQAWQQRLFSTLASDCSTSSGTYSAGNAVYGALKAAAIRYKNAQVVDLNSLVCPANMCPAVSADTIVFRDKQHLTDNFVNLISQDVLGILQIEDIRNRIELR